MAFVDGVSQFLGLNLLNYGYKTKTEKETPWPTKQPPTN